MRVSRVTSLYGATDSKEIFAARHPLSPRVTHVPSSVTSSRSTCNGSEIKRFAPDSRHQTQSAAGRRRKNSRGLIHSAKGDRDRGRSVDQAIKRRDRKLCIGVREESIGTVPSHIRAAQRGPGRKNAAQQQHGPGQHSRPAKIASPGHFASIGTAGGEKGDRDRAESSIKCRDRKLRRRARGVDWHVSQAQIRLTAREKAKKDHISAMDPAIRLENGAKRFPRPRAAHFLVRWNMGNSPGTMRERKERNNLGLGLVKCSGNVPVMFREAAFYITTASGYVTLLPEHFRNMRVRVRVPCRTPY